MSRSARITVLVAVTATAVAAFVVLRPGDRPPPSPTPTSAPPGRPATTAAARPAPPPIPVVRVRGGRPAGGVRRIEARRGDPIRFVVQSDRSGQIHVHGYDLEKPVAPGRPARFSFRAKSDGVYEVEAHPSHEQVAELRVLP